MARNVQIIKVDLCGFWQRYDWPAGSGLALLFLGARSLSYYYLHVRFSRNISAALYLMELAALPIRYNYSGDGI